jgi:hypothetical protein
MEREGGEERKEEKERAQPNRYALKGTSLGGTLVPPQGCQRGWRPPIHRGAGRAATSTTQGASESGALLCTKGVSHLDALQLGPDTEYVSLECIYKKYFSKELK